MYQHKFKYNQMTPSKTKAGHFITFASDLQLPPGRWPYQLCLVDSEGNPQQVFKTFISDAHYREYVSNSWPRWTITVFND